MSAWQNFWQSVADLFSVSLKFDVYIVLILLVYAGLGYLGYYLISQQIKLVKAEVFSFSDYLKCIIYSFVFASGFILIIIMLFVFYNFTKPELFLIAVTGDPSAIFLWTLTFSIIFLFIYPVFDLLFLAHSKENKGLTIFQEFLANKIIHKVSKPWTYIVALAIYILLYILPTTILILVGLPAFIVLMSVASVIPIVIITYFGVLGYINGYTNAYYGIPAMERSLFYSYAKEDRTTRELMQNKYSGFISRFTWGLQVFLYFWMMYSFIITFSKMFMADPPLIMENFQWSVFISLFFGIYGYFSRFWYRKIKFRWMDIMFSAWLVAVTGVNVTINYIVNNSSMFVDIFDQWSVTLPINLTNWFANGDFLLYVPAALIEEIVLVGLITYYFLGIGTDYFKKTKFSLVDTSAQTFKAIPLFNLIREKDEKLRNHAKEELFQMYTRIPFKNEIDLLDYQYMDPLFDAVCDWNKNANEMGNKILDHLMKEHPKLISPKVNDALQSPNYDKKLPVAKLVLENHEKILPYINQDIFYEMLDDPDYHIRGMGIDLLLKKPSPPTESQIGKIKGLLNDADYDIQAACLNLVNILKIQVNPALIFQKMDHYNEKIKGAAVLCLGSILDGSAKKESREMVSSLIKMLNAADGETEASIIKALGNIGNFSKYKVPIEPFLEGILDPQKVVRDAAEFSLSKYLNDWKGRKAKKILADMIADLGRVEDNIKTSILQVFKNTWEIDPELIIPVFLDYIKHPNKSLKSIAANALNESGASKPQLVLKNLLKTKEEKTYLKRGIVSETVIGILNNNPKLTKLMNIYLTDENENIRTNTASVLTGLGGETYDKLDIGKVISQINQDSSGEVKKNLLKFIGNVAESDVDLLKGHFKELFKVLRTEDKKVVVQGLKTLEQISEIDSDAVPLDQIVVLLNDKDSLVRESAIKVMGNIGTKQLEASFFIIQELLNDKDWSVKNAAMDVFKRLGMEQGNEQAINKIIDLVDDKEKFTRTKALEILSDLANKKPEKIPISKIKKITKDKDPDIRQKCAQIAGSFDSEYIDDVLPIIITLMGDKNNQVAERAQTALVRISSRMSLKELFPKTLHYFSDETDLQIQRSMALALKRIVKYESKTAKKRLIDILRIRCEISQDQTICQVLQDLKQD